jgi:hypothetical protein
MQHFKTLSAATVLAVACFMGAQQKAVPQFTLSVSHWTRTGNYDYRVVAEGGKQLLEMRQEGKNKWTRVEDITCHNVGRFESDSFDYVGECK